jgi:hypothetical protein
VTPNDFTQLPFPLLGSTQLPLPLPFEAAGARTTWVLVPPDVVAVDATDGLDGLVGPLGARTSAVGLADGFPLPGPVEAEGDDVTA